MPNLDKKYRILEFQKNQVISGSNYNDIFTITNSNKRGYLFHSYFSVSSDALYLRLNIDGDNIINGLLLDDITKSFIYNMSVNSRTNSFPIRPITNTSFILDFPEEGIQYKTLTLSLKKKGGGVRMMKGGMISLI
jgi:hypothetical protein